MTSSYAHTIISISKTLKTPAIKELQTLLIKKLSCLRTTYTGCTASSGLIL